jgi:hypothetical protein
MNENGTRHGRGDTAEIESHRAMPAEIAVVRSADVQALGDVVELTLDVATQGEAPRRLRFRMPSGIARDFALRLVHSAANLSCMAVGVLGGLDDGLLGQATGLAAAIC